MKAVVWQLCPWQCKMKNDWAGQRGPGDVPDLEFITFTVLVKKDRNCSQMIFIFLAGKRVNYRLYSSKNDSRVTIVCCSDSAKPGIFNVLINGHFRTLNTISFFHFLVGIFSSFLLGPFLARWAARWIDSSDCSQVRVQLYMHGWSCKVIICWRIRFIGYCCV